MSIDPFFYLPLAGVVIFIILAIFFFFEKTKIIEKYKQPNAVIIKNISGTTVTVNKGNLHYNKRSQWGSFDILINQNSMFLFPRYFYFIPWVFINLTFNSDRRNTKRPTVLREFHINGNSVELICYPDFFSTGKRTITLDGLSQEEVLIFQKALNKES